MYKCYVIIKNFLLKVYYTCDWKRGHAIHPDVCDRPRDGLTYVNKAVLDVVFRKQIAVKVQAVLSPDHPLFGHILQRAGGRE